MNFEEQKNNNNSSKKRKEKETNNKWKETKQMAVQTKVNKTKQKYFNRSTEPESFCWDRLLCKCNPVRSDSYDFCAKIDAEITITKQ